MSSQSATPSTNGQHPDSSPSDTSVKNRADRAREEDMDVALLKQGGIYEVEGTTGQAYRVDITEQSCTCPDSQNRNPNGGCKHIRRVELELDQGTIPRPDGKLPIPISRTDEVDDHDGAPPSDVNYQQERAAIIDAIQDREEEIARLQSEIEALEFVTDTLKAITDPATEFSLDEIRPEDY